MAPSSPCNRPFGPTVRLRRGDAGAGTVAAMPNLWTDHDDGAHPWIAGRAPGAAPPPVPAEPTQEPSTAGATRVLAFGAACVAAAVAGFVIEVLR